MYKPFSREAYNANNQPGIETALNLLSQHGFKTVEDGSSEAYSDRDCIVSDGMVNFKVEAEKSNIWRSDTYFPYQNVRVPQRKHRSNAYYYIQTNKDLTACLITKMDIVKTGDVVMQQCYNCPFPEPFFSIPISSFDWFIKQGDLWVHYKGKNGFISPINRGICLIDC